LLKQKIGTETQNKKIHLLYTMSLATLKRKTQSKYQNSSVGVKQFSVNGTYRNQGYIGQTSLSRSLPRTLAGGAFNKGHGGCCDTYTDLKTPIISAVTSTENNSVVKPAVLSSKGMLARRLRCCDQTVKPDNSTSLNTQSSYLEYLKNKCKKMESSTPLETSTGCLETCNYVKTGSDINESIAQSEYLQNIKGDVINCISMSPEFHRTNKSCTTGRGACGGD